MRKCNTCQHVRRAEIDRRLAAGEPGNQIARDYQLNRSSLHRHRINCLSLGSSSAIMKEVARGTAALACLPSKNDLNQAYSELRARIDQIVNQAQQEGSLTVAVSGLNSVRHTLDSLMRLAGHDRAPDKSQTDAVVAQAAKLDLADVAERLLAEFDHEPELKARIAQVLINTDAAGDPSAASAIGAAACAVSLARAAAPAGTSGLCTDPIAVAANDPEQSTTPSMAPARPVGPISAAGGSP